MTFVYCVCVDEMSIVCTKTLLLIYTSENNGYKVGTELRACQRENSSKLFLSNVSSSDSLSDSSSFISLDIFTKPES